MSGKTALITGITGQDGSYLAEFLIEKGYNVHGIKRRTSSQNISRISHLFDSAAGLERSKALTLHHGDMTDGSSLRRIISKTNPNEIYNLAAQSHVQVSFEEPEYTADSDAIGLLRILECIQQLNMKTRIYQASTSELYGGISSEPLSETSEMVPRSPYAAAKLYAFNISKIYREAYGMYVCNGILFNHESPRRGENFVTRKISMGVARILLGKQKNLLLGNLDAVRDWGHAKDYVEAQWLMLQQEIAKDYVIATGVAVTVREFVRLCFASCGVEIIFKGMGTEEIGVVNAIQSSNLIKPPKIEIGDKILGIDPMFFRPLEVNHLLGDASRARHDLGWKPKISLEKLVEEMMSHDLRAEG